MARLSLSDDDKAVRDWFATQVRAVGCSLSVDQMGSMFAVRPGKRADAAPVVMGSHLDTQPTGGRYDGILGVLAGLEVLRTLHDNNYETEGPIGIVNWTNEEGARFPLVTIASGVWSGAIPLQTAWDCREIPSSATPASGPQTVKQELARIGYLGDLPADHAAHPLAAHFELHIEQGPILERAERSIGVVTGAQACHWFIIRVTGRDSHAGTTPLDARHDALLAAAHMVVAANQAAASSVGGRGVATIGRLQAEPGNVNTIAHTATFTLDVRHAHDEGVAALVAQCRADFDAVARRFGVDVDWTTLSATPAVHFDTACIAAVQAAADQICGSNGHMRMISGATHDSCHASQRCPTAMVFTPTKDGLSHTPTEYCKPEDCMRGAQVLMGAVLQYDAGRFLT